MFTISAKVVSCNFRHVRQLLTHDTSVLVANALFSSQLDYCNSLFRSLSNFNLYKLSAPKIERLGLHQVLVDSITPVLKKLHWLPVEHCSVFKTAKLVYKFLHTGFPSILLHIYLLTVVLIVPGAVRVVVISLSF